ncbi:uncharacterized protein B4U79_13766 [Dinothrombium tinctorium]|uniref:Uncharacterized protein n=1 Tax=Dinothrombium tinctorium TaxID=1965070 RepID=A0A443QKD0_9ACAR|nr:uncharacterized protein B4U79_13766 [Dinothrombium tinctorium]
MAKNESMPQRFELVKDLREANITKDFASDEARNDFWGVSDRDVPILIGAAAGLDNESEGESVSSHGSQQFNSESVIFVGIKPYEEETNNNANIKRSISAPLHSSVPYAYTNMSHDANDLANCTESQADTVKILGASRCHLYAASTDKSDIDSFKTRSLPWRNSKRVSAEAEDIEDLTGSMTRVNFTKKRKNRMRNDSAAAIAMNLSGESPAQMPFLHKDTDSLVDNEAVVVYDERTAL